MRFVQIGIASFGSFPFRTCASSPGGFSRLSHDVLQWIRKVKVDLWQHKMNREMDELKEDNQNQQLTITDLKKENQNQQLTITDLKKENKIQQLTITVDSGMSIIFVICGMCIVYGLG